MAAIAYPYTARPGRPGGASRSRYPHLRLLTGEETRVVTARPTSRPRGLRRWAPGLATAAALVGLWFGAGALAGAGGPRIARLPGTTPVSGGYAYVVRPGDTLWSIASRLEPGGDPGALVARLTAELSTTVLRPGSVIVVP